MIERLVVGVMAIALAGSTAQDDPTRTDTTPEVTDTGYTVQASDAGSLTVVDAPRSSPVGTWIECSYFHLASIDAPVELTASVVPRVWGVYQLACWHEPDHVVVAGYPVVVQYDPLDPVPGLVDVVDVAEFALSRLDLESPTVELSPATAQIVGIETWLAVVSELDYPEVTAQAGLAWATVRTTFVDAVWELGDGSTVTCDEEVDVVWDPSLTGEQQASACTYAFVETSPEGGYRASATVTWAFDWINNEAPDGFVPWTTLSLTTPVTIEVDQLQAVIR